MSEIITSTKNERVKLVYGLQNRSRTRRKERKICLEGLRLIEDAIKGKNKPEFIFYDPQRIDEATVEKWEKKRFLIFPATEEVIVHMSDTENPAGVVAVFPLPTPRLPKKAKRTLILDAIQDPGNMGSILRSAGAAGVELVILTTGSVDPYNPKVLRSAMGAHFRIPILEAGWDLIGEFLGETPIYTAVANAEHSCYDVDWTKAWALAIGNEAHGMSHEGLEAATEPIGIPMADKTESLNASIAASVILFEAHRQSLMATKES